MDGGMLPNSLQQQDNRAVTIRCLRAIDPSEDLLVRRQIDGLQIRQTLPLVRQRSSETIALQGELLDPFARARNTIPITQGDSVAAHEPIRVVHPHRATRQVVQLLQKCVLILARIRCELFQRFGPGQTQQRHQDDQNQLHVHFSYGSTV